MIVGLGSGSGQSSSSGGTTTVEADDLAALQTRHRGVCVECMSDCDCGVNEFCGYDYKDKYNKDKDPQWTFEYKVTIPSGITSSNEGLGMPANVKKEIELYAKQYEGLPIRSKCKKYSTSHIKGKPKVCNRQINKDAFSKMVEQSLVYPSSFDPGALMKSCDMSQGPGQSVKVKRTPTYWPKDAEGALILYF